MRRITFWKTKIKTFDMKSRLDKIVIGCGFIKGLINDNKQGSEIFKTAARRLIGLIQDELDGKVETVSDMSTGQIEAIFQP